LPASTVGGSPAVEAGKIPPRGAEPAAIAWSRNGPGGPDASTPGGISIRTSIRRKSTSCATGAPASIAIPGRAASSVTSPSPGEISGCL
jgi:hypothetical protein